MKPAGAVSGFVLGGVLICAGFAAVAAGARVGSAPTGGIRAWIEAQALVRPDGREMMAARGHFDRVTQEAGALEAEVAAVLGGVRQARASLRAGQRDAARRMLRDAGAGLARIRSRAAVVDALRRAPEHGQALGVVGRLNLRAMDVGAGVSLQGEIDALARLLASVEAQMESVRNERQAMTAAFENFDQKSQQLKDELARILKAMQEMRMGVVRNMD